MRTIIIGDIHGCHQELLMLLAKVQLDREQDKLISLGDLMDRGDRSFQVFETFRVLKADMGERCVIIRGNHEQMMLDASVNPFARILWKQNGGGKTIKSFYRHQDGSGPARCLTMKRSGSSVPMQGWKTGRSLSVTRRLCCGTGNGFPTMITAGS